MSEDIKRVCIFCHQRWTTRSKHSGIQCPKCKRYQRSISQEAILHLSEKRFRRFCEQLDCKIRLNKAAPRLAGFPQFTVRDKRSNQKCYVYLKNIGRGLQRNELFATEKLHKKKETVALIFIDEEEMYCYRLFRIDSANGSIKQEG